MYGAYSHGNFLRLFLDGAMNSLAVAIDILKSSSSFGSMIEVAS
jgi:hypothetical protein